MAEAVFQTFDQKTTPAQGAPHLKALRAEIKARGLDGFVVPRTDEHQNEYVPPSSERLAWLTGFSGSWGTAIVLHDLAAISLMAATLCRSASRSTPPPSRPNI